MSPLETAAAGHDTDTNNVYSLLQLTLVDIITSSESQQLPAKYLSHLTEGLVSRLESGTFSPDQIQTALDRFGQIMAAALAGDKLKLDKDLLILMKKLPSNNRLVNIIIKNNS